MGTLFLLLILLGLYLLPSFVASSRRHRNANAIIVLNLLLGWTFLGWVAALVWAATDNVNSDPDKELLLNIERDVDQMKRSLPDWKGRSAYAAPDDCIDGPTPMQRRSRSRKGDA